MRIVRLARAIVGATIVGLGYWVYGEDNLREFEESEGRGAPPVGEAEDAEVPAGTPAVELSDVAMQMIRDGMAPTPPRAPAPVVPLKGSIQEAALEARRAAGVV